jgi:phenylalanyl-tRNA synthetase beta chain
MGGKIYSMELDYQGKKEITPNLTPDKMTIKLENFNKLIGLDITEKELEKLLGRMGYDYDSKTKTALVPAWRTDVLHEVDIIEDAAIAYGYNNLTPEIPKVATMGEESKKEKIKSKIAEILIGLDMLEISTYHMIKEEEFKNLKLDEKEKIPLEDSKTEYKILRPNLIIPALRTLAENKDNEYPQRFFEIGTAFELDKDNKTQTGIAEPEKLCIALASNTSNFTDIKQIFDYLARMLNKNYTLEQPSQEKIAKSFFIEGRTAEIKVNNKKRLNN